MLHFIRDRAQGWIAWLIVGLISIPFALWGVNSYLTGASDVVVAEVNGKEITQAELQQSLQQYRDQMRNMMGEQFDPAMFEGAMVKRNVLDGLIEQQLLRDANEKLGQRINDAEISQVIRTTPAFQRDGEFDSEYYNMVLARVGYSPASYEAQLRADLMSQQLTQNIETTALATEKDVRQTLRLQEQRREIAYGVVPVQEYVEQVSVTDDEVQQLYDNHQSNYQSPEQLKLNYIELSVATISSTLTVTEDDLKQFYADNQSQFVGPQQRRASHILIEGDDSEAQTTIEAIATRLENGEDFSSLAEELSQDPGSASQGGDLGFFERDVMDPAFEEAAFSLEMIGDVSEPVKTEFGYHLIKLTDIKQPEGQEFSQVRDEVEKLYRRQQAESIFYDKAEQLANLSYENPDNLDVAADDLELQIKTTESFTRNGTESGIASEQKVIAAAFGDDVLKNDLNSAVIELADDHLVVIHKNSYTPSTVLPFDSVSPAIEQQLLFEKASEKAREHGESLLNELKQDNQATDLLPTWQEAEFYGRDSDNISMQILQRAFAMSKPESGSEFAGFTANNGNYIVIELTAVDEGKPADVGAEDQQALKQQLTQVHANAEVQAFITSLREQADIEILDETLQ
ncbi:Peptidyl-prolyl cis-trans isomerase ppiD [Methylophaga thiooxydans]|uniref:Periplasmic chaperone PpiD n=1 Tax=Methylophaga thiooxydans TaxID=392484 RepID=A0A0A0BH08_9GAMM|nr:SurA N-terminal domain-containing protein [Methylophaga thiooxydans]KGM06982.1 Peptidyl-prolyl cis-trans isomerase ppiD [Methylophaga thiooxydans]